MEQLASLGHVFKQLDRRLILRDVSFSVEQGDIFGFLGPSGAGKTTSIRIMLGLFGADSGSASVFGGTPGSEAVQRRIGFVLEADGLYNNLTATEDLAYYARLYDISAPERRGFAARPADRLLPGCG